MILLQFNVNIQSISETNCYFMKICQSIYSVSYRIISIVFYLKHLYKFIVHGQKDIKIMLVTGLVSRCDIFSVPVGLKAGAQGKVKSFFAGIISLIIAVLFIYFLTTKIISVIKYENISSSAKQQKIKDKNSVKSSFTTFAFGADELSNEQFLAMFSPFIGVHKNKKLIKQFSLQACNISKWDGLDQDTFDQYGLGYLLCPTNDDPFFMDGTYRSQKPDYITLTIKGCKKPPASQQQQTGNDSITDDYIDTEGLTYTCDENAAKQYIIAQTLQSRGMEFFFYIYDIVVYEDQFYPIKRSINFDIKSLVNQRLGEEVYVEWATFRINTDVSIYPWKDIRKENDTFIENIRSVQFPIDMNNLTGNPVSIVTFTMNQKLITYTRQVDKLTQALAATGGLFSLIIPLIGFCIIRYNAYNYDLQVARDTFRDEEKAEKPPSPTNLIVFIKYTIYNFINRIFCCSVVSWSDCKQISARKREAVSLMEIGRIFKRIQQLQTAIKHSVDRNQATCLTLTQQPTLKEAKNFRLQSSYYTVITKDRSQVAICDLRKEYDAVNLTLQQFYKTKLESRSSTNNGSGVGLTPGSVGSGQQLKAVTLGNVYQDGSGSQKIIIDKTPEDNTSSVKPFEFKKQKVDFILLDKILNEFEEIKKEAAEIEIPSSYVKIQQNMSRSFYNMRPQVRASLQQKIPLLVLCRLMTGIKGILTKSAAKKKASRVQSQKPENEAKKSKLQKKDQSIDTDKIQLNIVTLKQNEKDKKIQKKRESKRKERRFDSEDEQKIQPIRVEGNDAKKLLDGANHNNDPIL